MLSQLGWWPQLPILVLKVLGNDQVTVKASKIEGVPAAEFPPLPYGYNALEPYIDARTMEIHYDKHHRAYYTNFLNAIKGTPLEGMTLSAIFSSVSKQPDAVRNNGGGYYNHLFFWNNLGKVPQDLRLNYLQLLQRHLVPLINSRKLLTLLQKHGLEADGPGYILPQIKTWLLEVHQIRITH